MNRVSKVGSYGVILRDEQILMCQLTRSRKWTLPGGGVEFGEHPSKTMIREVQEETGFRVQEGELIGVNSTLVVREDEDTEIHVVQIVYRTEISGGEMRIEENGSTDLCEWCDLDELASKNLSGVAEYAAAHLGQLVA